LEEEEEEGKISSVAGAAVSEEEEEAAAEEELEPELRRAHHEPLLPETSTAGPAHATASGCSGATRSRSGTNSLPP
jgi:hypothetical protein